MKYSKRSRVKWLVGLLALLLILLCGIGYVAYIVAYKPVGRQTDSVYLYVGAKPSMHKLREQIQTKLWPYHPSVLDRFIAYSRLEEHLHTGRYAVSPQTTMLELIDRLKAKKTSPVRLNLSAIRTESDLVKAVSQHLMMPSEDFRKALHDSTFLAKHSLDKESVRSLFFAEVYSLDWDISPSALMDSVASRHRAYWTSDRLRRLDSLGISSSAVSTLASIVEEESAKTSEYPTIARLYLNRLKQSMPLQSDPTVKFALGDFALRRILHEHLQQASPYNTYQVVGLPPGPIRLPRSSTIDAVLTSPEHSYLYMCAKEDFSGYHRFATDYATHLSNARLYQQALNARGIR